MNPVLSFLSTTFITNWKTSLAGIITIVLGALPMVGIVIPGGPGITTAIVAGLGLILAQDGKSDVPPPSPTPVTAGS
jgi:hypothetical protein